MGRNRGAVVGDAGSQHIRRFGGDVRVWHANVAAFSCDLDGSDPADAVIASEAKQSRGTIAPMHTGDCFASLAMTVLESEH